MMNLTYRISRLLLLNVQFVPSVRFDFIGMNGTAKRTFDDEERKGGHDQTTVSFLHH